MAQAPVTEEQWRQCRDAVEVHGTMAAAAKALKMPWSTFKNRIRSGDALYGPEGRAQYDGKAPDGYLVKGRSTYYGPDGEVRGEWVKTTADQERQRELFKAAIDELAKDLPRVKEIKPPVARDDDVLAFIPVGDHHLGAYCWHEETGNDYDIEIAESLLMGATEELFASIPKAGTCVIAYMGDFMDYDSWESVTPTSKNQLDADGRFPKMVRAAIRCMRRMIEGAAKRYGKVHVIVEIGNHDLASSIFLMECLANIYEGNPRITVDTSPKHFHYFEFGNVLIGTHHGHGVRMPDLPLLMAADMPDVWGRTKHRHWFMGHIHHKSKLNEKDYPGCTVESLRVLCGNTAWAANHGYRPIPGMVGIKFHREFGERARHNVTPDMLRAA